MISTATDLYQILYFLSQRVGGRGVGGWRGTMIKFSLKNYFFSGYTQLVSGHSDKIIRNNMALEIQ